MTSSADRRAFMRAWAHALFYYFPLIVRTSRRIGRLPDCVRPRSADEKFLWRKIFDRNPLFTIACDKLAGRGYAMSRYPKLKAAQTLWTGTDVDTIPAELIAGNAVLKANCGSGMVAVIREGQPNRIQLKGLATKWLAKPYERHNGEWGYTLGRRILLLESLLADGGQPIQREYKFHVAGGRTAYVVVKLGSPDIGKHFLVLDRDGRAWTAPSNGEKGVPSSFRPPALYAEMREMAERIAAEYDFVRVDLYLVDDDFYFSELTVYPSSGFGGAGGREELLNLRNEMWDLRRSWFLSNAHEGWRADYAAALRRFLNASA